MATNVSDTPAAAAGRTGGSFFGTAYLVGVQTRDTSPEETQRSLDELALLAKAARLQPVGRTIATVREINPATLLGTGTVRSIAEAAREAGSEVIVVDTALLPRQQRNLERETEAIVTDRPAIILEIFSLRASTREAKLQVELARVEYELPRLTGKWQHLSRQGGGSRLARGEGEKQLEVDRRIVLRRASTIRRDLKRVERQRALRRQRRSGVYRASLVGYTNAGKTTLLNALTGSHAFAANQLFATLDPSSRRFQLAGHAPVVCTDTVGFVRRLPHSLVKAFHSTLEEAVQADLRIFVVDASDPAALGQLETTFDVMAEINGEAAESILVLNKADRCRDIDTTLLAFRGVAPEMATFVVSARNGRGVPELREAIAGFADAAAGP